jgi:hypothetical protein
MRSTTKQMIVAAVLLVAGAAALAWGFGPLLLEAVR